MEGSKRINETYQIIKFWCRQSDWFVDDALHMSDCVSTWDTDRNVNSYRPLC